MKLTINKNLAPLKLEAKNNVDFQAGEVRKLFITVTPGQDMVYIEKRNEAEKITTDPNINPAYVPHLAKEAALNDISLLEMAATILTMENQWKYVSAIIEEKRLATKQLIDNATSEAEIMTALNINWSLQ